MSPAVKVHISRRGKHVWVSAATIKPPVRNRESLPVYDDEAADFWDSIESYDDLWYCAIEDIEAYWDQWQKHETARESAARMKPPSLTVKFAEAA